MDEVLGLHSLRRRLCHTVGPADSGPRRREASQEIQELCREGRWYWIMPLPFWEEMNETQRDISTAWKHDVWIVRV